MKRNCNLELRLVTPSVISHSSSYYYGQYKSNADEKQKLTIFYNGKIAACDVTELQARAIISLASQEIEEKSKNSTRPDPPSQMVNTPLYSTTAGLSMKRSLQRFLQKRKTRAQATKPYPINFRHSN